MKILMIAPEPFFTPRGTPISVLTRAKALNELGHDIHILTYHLGDNVKIPRTVIHRIPRLPIIKSVPVGISCKKIILDLILIFSSIFLVLKENCDCIHAHEEAAIFGVILKKVFRKPLIYDMHSSITDHLFRYTGNRYLSYFGVILESWIFRNSNLIIVISASLKKKGYRFSAQNKVFLIENISIFNDAVITEEAIENIKKELDIKDEKIILYTGTFEHYQGLDILIKSIPIVVESNRNVKFIMVGGETFQINDLKKLATSLNVREYVLFTGSRPLHEMPLFMALAYILVSPRREEHPNPPIKLYNYINSGVPIVATKVPANSEVLTDEISILTDLEPISFANGIISLLENEELRKQIITNLDKVKLNYNDFLTKVDNAYSHLRHSV